MEPGTGYIWQARTVAMVSSGEYNSPWSERVIFESAVYRLGAPRPVDPAGGARVGRDSVFSVRNGRIEGDLGPVIIEIQIAVACDFDGRLVSGEAQMQGSAGGRTRIRIGARLESNTSYCWRARAQALRAPFGPVFSDWSESARFRTRDVAALGPAKAPIPNLQYVLERVARAHPAELEAAYDNLNFEFLDLLIEALQEEDGGRWGFTYWTRPGFPSGISRDIIGYYRGSESGNPYGSTDIAIIDVLSRYNRQLGWLDGTESSKEDYPDARGEWRYPRDAPGL